MLTVNNKTNTISFNAGAFIIPNPGGILDDWTMDTKRVELKKFARRICKLNGKEFDPEEDQFAQMWFHATEDLDDDNIFHHHISFTDEDGVEWWVRYSLEEYLPKKLFEGCKEGDVINLKYPATFHQVDNETRRWDVTLDMTVTLAQLPYRYGGSGNFEDVLRRV